MPQFVYFQVKGAGPNKATLYTYGQAKGMDLTRPSYVLAPPLRHPQLERRASERDGPIKAALDARGLTFRMHHLDASLCHRAEITSGACLGMTSEDKSR